MTDCYRPHPKDGGKVMFSVCQFTPRLGGGGTPSQVQADGGYPIPGQDRRGYPILLTRGGGYPISGLDGGTPSQVWKGGIPSY